MIFIVDDDDGARASLRVLLECEGWEAREFASCREFLDAVKPGEGACLILDVHMPG
ncbi:MAG: response regulator, partial [Alphaproteobacteria bacterium]|nr:response regulator [Alphaproteobacteria bacterium]